MGGAGQGVRCGWKRAKCRVALPRYIHAARGALPASLPARLPAPSLAGLAALPPTLPPLVKSQSRTSAGGHASPPACIPLCHASAPLPRGTPLCGPRASPPGSIPSRHSRLAQRREGVPRAALAQCEGIT
jgi:hypothetical protein